MPKPTTDPVDTDAEIIQGVLHALIEGYGRGGKTWLAKKTGLSLSTLSKRLKLPGAGLDDFTMRVIMLAVMTKRDEPVENAQPHGDYLVGIEDHEPRWTPNPQPNEP